MPVGSLYNMVSQQIMSTAILLSKNNLAYYFNKHVND